MHLCGFSPLWISLCLFRSPAWPKESPHSSRLCSFSPVCHTECGWSCASSNVLLDQMTSYILNKCGLWLHCEWACASSDVLLGQMISYILNNCASVFHFVWAQASPFFFWLICKKSVRWCLYIFLKHLRIIGRCNQPFVCLFWWLIGNRLFLTKN